MILLGLILAIIGAFLNRTLMIVGIILILVGLVLALSGSWAY